MPTDADRVAFALGLEVVLWVGYDPMAPRCAFVAVAKRNLGSGASMEVVWYRNDTTLPSSPYPYSLHGLAYISKGVGGWWAKTLLDLLPIRG